MNKYLILLITIILISAKAARSQNISALQSSTISKPLNSREVSGIVIDTADTPVEGITVLLTTEVDTITSATNAKGIFILKDIHQATFSLTVSGLGYRRFVKKYFLNDEAPKLVLDPVVMSTDGIQLNEVTVNGTPSIVYKTDTTEYRAADYKVRKNATVDELLKKMEGVHIARDGSLSFQGQSVVKAKLNGKTFGEGIVAETIQSLPAEIVEKAQFVDDYGDQATRTGIKSGNPIKILNLTTKADKSIANLARNSIGAGNSDRYYERLYLHRINANQQIGIVGNIQKVLNGIAPNSAAAAGTYGAETGTGDSGGYMTKKQGSLDYRDQWSKNIQVNSFYSIRSNNINGVNYTNGKLFSSNGTTNFIDNEVKLSRTQNQQFRFEFELTPDSLNFLRVTPSFNSASTKSSININNMSSGYLNQDINGRNNQVLTSPTYEILALYQRLFKGSRRNISVQANFSNSNQHDLNEKNYHLLYKDSSQLVLRDSLQHFRVDRRNVNRNYRSSFTYVEPFSSVDQIEFNAQLNYRGYDNKAFTDSISTLGEKIPISSLTNIYHYSFTELRFSLNYRYTKRKNNLSVGLTAMPTVLKGGQSGISMNRPNFNLIPIFRYEHAFSQTERFSIFYNGNATEPSFVQIQPFSDRSDPQNVIVGNPRLKPSFYHSINLAYNHYMANPKINISVNSNIQLVRNKVTDNIAQIPLPSVNSYYNEFRFQNINGVYNWTGYHSVSKQLANGKLNLEFDGSLSYGRDKSVSNDHVYQSNSWSVAERLGLMLNLVEWLEINPDISYKVFRTFFSQPGAINRDIRTTALNLESRLYINSWKTGAELNKNYNEGIAINKTKNPLVINAYLEKALLNGNNGLLRIQLFDVLKQNNWINQTVSSYGITNANSNVQSRYGYVSFVYAIQQWKGTPKKNGKPRKRRGDGSFLY